MFVKRFGGGLFGFACLIALVAGTVASGMRTAAAQSAATVTPVVSVAGHGSVTVTPDIATVVIGVQISNPSLAEAQSQATTQMAAVLAALKNQKIKDADIQTTYFNVNVVSNYDDVGNPTEVIGYQVSNQVTVTIRDIEKIGPILEDAVAAGSNSIYGITFGVEDSSKATSEARVKAVADAKQRATELAEAAGLTLGPVVSINEGTGSLGFPYGQRAGGQGAGPSIQPGSLEISVDVEVTYQLG